MLGGPPTRSGFPPPSGRVTPPRCGLVLLRRSQTADGAVEMMRQLKVARDSAVKARTTAMSTLKQILVNAPPVLREPLQALTDRALVTRCAGLRPGPLDTPVASGKHTLRSLARRWLTLADDSTTHDLHLARLTAETSPTLREGFAVGANTAAAMVIIFGDNPERIRSEAAFAKLCGACPVPASSGMTTGRHRLYRGGHRQANAALHRAGRGPYALSPADDRLCHPTQGGWTDETGHHPLPETLSRSGNLSARHERLPHAPTAQ